MEDSAGVTCPRCGTEILVVSPGVYLDVDVDFALHQAGDTTRGRPAISDAEGNFMCPECGKPGRLPSADPEP